MPKLLLPLPLRLGQMMGECRDDGCRPWLGYVNPQTGYGQLHVSASERAEHGFNSRTVTGPVAVATICHGVRPPGRVVLHSCDNKLCVEPRHLRWGTQAENCQEAWTRGGQLRGAEHHQARHSDAEVRTAIERVKAGESATSVASDIGIDNSTLSKWVRGQGRGAEVTT